MALCDADRICFFMPIICFFKNHGMGSAPCRDNFAPVAKLKELLFRFFFFKTNKL